MDLRFIPVEKAQIYLLFYKPTNTDPFQNRLVAFFDGPFSHVEMAIPKRYGDEPWERVVWGSSIYQNESVFFKEKTYKREGYISFAIEVTMVQVQQIISYCRFHAMQETPFSKWAMYAAYFPIQLVHTEATFCSKHVALALQSAGVQEVEGINPALTTPSLLHRLLTSGSRAILQIVPSKMQQSETSIKENGGSMMMRSIIMHNNNNNNMNNTNSNNFKYSTPATAAIISPLKFLSLSASNNTNNNTVAIAATSTATATINNNNSNNNNIKKISSFTAAPASIMNKKSLLFTVDNHHTQQQQLSLAFLFNNNNKY